MIEKYLYILLQHHDEVIVPNLGAFLATYSSSQIQSSKIKPPHKKIVFYPQLNYDKSALLKKRIIHEENITEGEFDIVLEHFLNKVEEDITFKFKSHLDKLGTLTRKPNGELAFEQSEDSNLLVASFGLPNLDFKPIDSSTKTTVTNPKIDKKEEETNTKSEHSKKDEKTMNSDYNYSNPEEESDDKNSLILWLLIIPLAFILIFLVYFFFQKTNWRILNLTLRVKMANKLHRWKKKLFQKSSSKRLWIP